MSGLQWTAGEVTDKQLRDTGFTAKARDYPKDETALRLVCAFNGVDPAIAPPGWWFHPNASSREAWLRVIDEAQRMFQPVPVDREQMRSGICAVLEVAHVALRNVDASDTTIPQTDATLESVAIAVSAVERMARDLGYRLSEFRPTWGETP